MRVNDTVPGSGDSEGGCGKRIQTGNPECHLKAVLGTYPDGFFLLSGKGEILWCNDALSNMTGYDSTELCSMNPGGLFADELLMNILNSRGKDSKSAGDFRMESMCTKKDGTVFPVELTVKFIDISDKTKGIVFVRNISRERLINDENSKLRNQLNHAQTLETIGHLAGGISHYFNNVFTGILGNLSLAEIDAPEKIALLIRQAVNSADRARGFTRQILSLSRKSNVVPEPTDIGAIIEDVKTFACLAFDRRIEFTVVKHGQLQGILADAASIHHVLLNLCVNARDAIEEKHRISPDTSKPRITVEASNVTVKKSYIKTHPDACAGRYVRIAVSDTGCGMNDETRKQIFEPFYTTKEPGKGTGLGLATALETIRQHGGWIETESEVGKGSTFTVFLPTVSLKKKLGGEFRTDDLPKGSETILFVDDEEMVRTFGIMTLERLGYKVFGASDGQEMLDVFIREHDGIDLVVLDLGLPVLSGWDALEKIRRIDPDVKVIIATGYDFEHDRKAFDELRALDYILKPFNISDLAVSVRNVLDRDVKH